MVCSESESASICILLLLTCSMLCQGWSQVPLQILSKLLTLLLETIFLADLQGPKGTWTIDHSFFVVLISNVLYKLSLARIWNTKNKTKNTTTLRVPCIAFSSLFFLPKHFGKTQPEDQRDKGVNTIITNGIFRMTGMVHPLFLTTTMQPRFRLRKKLSCQVDKKDWNQDTFNPRPCCDQDIFWF